MENKEVKQNIRLGAFVLGGLTLFLIALFYLGRENNIFSKTFTISAVFKNVEGLKEGDNVWLSGVKIGTVKRVQIIDHERVIVDLSLKDKQNQFIKTDATAFVGSDGFVGNKIVVIRPGSGARAIHDNDTINSISPTDTQELFNLAKEVGATTRSITDDLKIISAKLSKGEGFVGELLHEGPLSQDLRETIVALKKTSENAGKVTEHAQTLMAEVNTGDGLLNKLVTDSSYAVTFETTLHNLGEVGKNSKKMSEDLQAIIDKMNSGDNALSVLLTDSTFAHQLKETLGNAQSASIKLDENMEAMQHNFLLRGYFRKQRKQQEAARNSTAAALK
jgi:phospholipid/cholesterol/gamma-HCH transport system substrate-binding protein